MATAIPSILAAFLAHVAHTPDRVCLIDGSSPHRASRSSLTYLDLAINAQAWAQHLQLAGVVRGDRVGLYLESSPTFVAAYLGVHVCGATVVLINTSYRQVELCHILSDSGAQVVITDTALLPELERVQPLIPQPLQPIRADTPLTRPPTFTPPTELPQPDDLALLAYTSGTTGRSKGAMLLHRNLVANSRTVTAAWQWTSADTLLLTLPLFHIHGLGVGVHGSLLVGGVIDVRPHFVASEVLATLRSGGATMFFGVPTMYARLIEAAQNDPSAQPNPLPTRLCVSGSAPLSPQHFSAFEAHFGQRILERYGMTETVMNTTNPYVGERRAGTVGAPFPGQAARVVELRSRQELPAGAVGEIQVRGPHVFAGYWQRPEATAEAFDTDGWFNTGDLGWRSDDGYFTITGRAKELIITGGYNVYPREVEEVLMSHPAVAEAAVIGRPDADLGEQVVAVVVLRAGHQASAQELIEHCKERMASYKKPRHVAFAASLPRNALGKVVKGELQVVF